jgi:peptide/nickel transport system permease protein
MRSYTLRRLLLIIPTLLLVTIIVFLTVRLVPGNVVDLMTSELSGLSGGSPVKLDRAAVEHMLGLDVPIHVQYVRWIGKIVLHGDFGRAIWTPTTVLSEIGSRLPVSIELGIMGLIIALIIAFPIGIWSAIRQDTLSDYIWRTVSIIFISVPGFWIGTMVMVYPSIWWHWSPPMEYIKFQTNLPGNLGMNLIPAVLLGIALSGTTMRMTRTMMLEVLRQDYIRTAWAKGLRERVVIMRHALKNALIPVVTIIGMQLPVLIGGTVIIEQIFNIPGIGRLMVGAIGKRDYPIVSGVNLMIASFVLLSNMFVDMTYAYLDPRVQYR